MEKDRIYVNGCVPFCTCRFYSNRINLFSAIFFQKQEGCSLLFCIISARNCIKQDRFFRRNFYYINAPGGARMVYVSHGENINAGTLFYLLTDHQGSVTHVVDEWGNLAQEYSYDAWGRRRDKNTLQPYAQSFFQTASNLTPFFIDNFCTFDRGYTGHEHLDAFGMINMNGRLYDPVMARMLSPDNYVQDPENTQNYNRYSYCLNNPLKYVDPSGENYTDYRNEKGELLYKTDDGLKDVIIVNNSNIPKLKQKLQDAKDKGTIDNPETNKKEMHPLGKKPSEYTNEALKDVGDYWRLGYKETYNDTYNGNKPGWLSRLASAFVAGIATDHNDNSGEMRNAGRETGIIEGERDRKDGRINRLNPTQSFKNNLPLIKLTDKEKNSPRR